jgi:hypothetical protein
MKSRWIDHKGQKLFWADYSSLLYDAFQAELILVDAELAKQPPKSARCLVDTRGMIITPREFELFKKYAVSTQAHVAKTAVLGVTGARKVMMDMLIKFANMSLTAFDDLEQAKDWLAQ